MYFNKTQIHFLFSTQMVYVIYIYYIIYYKVFTSIFSGPTATT